jgi:hypothetical protein
MFYGHFSWGVVTRFQEGNHPHLDIGTSAGGLNDSSNGIKGRHPVEQTIAPNVLHAKRCADHRLCRFHHNPFPADGAVHTIPCVVSIPSLA